MPCPLELPAPDGATRLLWLPASCLFPVETCQHTHLTRRLWHPTSSAYTHTQRSAVIPKAWLLQIQAMPETVPEGKGTDEENLQHPKQACIMQRGDEQQSLQHPGQACAQPHTAISPSGIKDVGSCICHMLSKQHTVKTTPEPPARAAERERCQLTQKHHSLVKSLYCGS